MLLTELKHTCDSIGHNLNNTIIQEVAEAYQLDAVDIMGSSRVIPIPEARKMTYYILFVSGYHLSLITDKYGTSRSSIYTALNDIPDLMRIYSDVRAKYNQVINNILTKVNNEIETNAKQIRRHA